MTNERTLIWASVVVIISAFLFILASFINDNYRHQWDVFYQSQTQIACIKAGMQVIDGDCVAP